jgi:hypothetical protein
MNRYTLIIFATINKKPMSNATGHPANPGFDPGAKCHIGNMLLKK